MPAAVLPYIANQTGWIAAEVGRQPWIVWGELRTSDALSASVTGGQVLGSILMFLVIYALLFILFIFVLNDKIQTGPEAVTEGAGKAEGFVRVASNLAEPGGKSMTGMRNDTSDDTE